MIERVGLSECLEYQYLATVLQNELKTGQLDKLHEQYSASRLDEVYKRIHAIMEKDCVRTTSRIVWYLGFRGLNYISTTLNLRFITPKSFVEQADKELSWQFKGHPIHIDSNYNLAVNNRNIWIPFTDIDEKNTLEVYDKKETVRFVGESGTAFLFDSDIPHKTVIAESCDRTRVTLTLRFCSKRPIFRDNRGLKYKMRWIWS